MPPSSRPISRAAFLRSLGALGALALLRPPRALHASHPHHHAGREHPEPRPGITAERIPANDTLGIKRDKEKERVFAAYDAARTNPEIFDGLACACGCTGAGQPHRSFLTCYETRQATGCGGCIEQGELVTKLLKQGKTLAEIRQAVDKLN